MIIVIDNYDSFTFNIVQVVSRLTSEEVRVFRSKETDLKTIISLNPSKLIISPGPETPDKAGISVEAIKFFAGKIPILGVCLGHQAIGYAFGANIIGAKFIRHGIVEEVELDGKGLFRHIGNKCEFTRYHSLVIEEKSLDKDFEITARAKDGDIMGIRHKIHNIEGVQFHPESIASKSAEKFFAAFLNYRRENLPVKNILNTLIKRENLSKETAIFFMEDLTDGFQDERISAAILSALAVKNPSADEIAGCASVLAQKKEPLHLDIDSTDLVGTGGDEKGSFNISSLASIIAASCGIIIAKHGNRAISSKSGAADFYEALGIKIDHAPQKSVELIKNTGFGFFFAPLYHKAMRHASSVRNLLGVKTIMNLIGPLCNPINAPFQVIGVYDKNLLIPMAKASKMLGTKRIMMLHSEDGFDEISPCAKTHIAEIREDNELKVFEFDPSEVGILSANSSDLKGGSAEHNAKIALEILENPSAHETITQACLLNAGATIYINDKAKSIAEGYKIAKIALENGAALAKFREIKEQYNA